MIVNGGIELGFVGASPSTLSNKEDAKRFGIYDDINYIANINDLDNGFLFILLGRYLHWSGFYTKESLKEGFFKWIDIYVKC